MLSFFFCLIAVGFLIFQFQHSYGVDPGNNSTELEKMLGKYWSWWFNSPEDQPEKNPICSMGTDKNNSLVFFINPFEVGDVAYNCTSSPIPRGHSIMFPLLTAFCSQGDNGLYKKSYEEIRDCTLNLDRGRIKGIVTLDDKVIGNISKDNGNGIEMKPKLINNLPQYNYYKEILPSAFVDFLATKNTTNPSNWQKPEEFEKSPIYYKAVVHCDCVIIDTSDLGPGKHTLKYIVDSVGGKSSIDSADKGWKFRSTATYQIATQ
jgi:hypothetical protein